MAIAARRLGLDPAELARRNLIPADGDALPHAVRGAVRLGRLRGLPRPGARARGLRRAAARGSPRRAPRAASPGSASPASSSPRSRTWATSRSRRPPTSAPWRCRSRATPRARRSRSTRSAGITVRLATTPQGQGHRTVCAQVVADVLGCTPDDVTVMSEMDTASVPWTSRRATTRRGSPASRSAPSRLRRSSSARRSTRSARTPATTSLSLRRVAGMAHWNPEGLPDGEEPGLAAVAFWAPPTLDPPDADDRVASSAAHGFIVDICAVEVDRETGEVRRARLRHGARRRAAAQPAARRRAGARRLRPRRRRRALRAPRLRRVGQPDDGVARRLPRADRARHPGAPDRPPLVAVARDGARGQGDRRGQHDERARLHRERRRRRDRPRRRRAAADAAARLGAPADRGWSHSRTS